jgi:hypothetical protein
MPIHDWSRVEDASFHDFHQAWLAQIRLRLNTGLLTEGYFAHIERHFGRFESNLLALSIPPSAAKPTNGHPTRSGGSAGVAVATKPPKAMTHLTANPTRRSTVAVRESGTRRVVALIELASTANKDRPENVAAYVGKARAALDARVHVVHLDILPPTKFTPIGLGGAIWTAVNGNDYPFTADKPLAADGFQAGRVVELYANALAVGDELPEVPLFLSEEIYIDLPLASTYAEVFASIAPDDRELLSRPA